MQAERGSDREIGSWRDRVVAYYDETWPQYARHWAGGDAAALHIGFWGSETRTHAQSLIQMNRVIAEVCRLDRDESVLDAGCGVGGTSVWLAREYGARVSAVTLSAQQAELASDLCRSNAEPLDVNFSVQDFNITAFPPNTFDRVWAQESVVHAVEKSMFMDEAFRVLKPGGRVVLAEYFLQPEKANYKDERLLRAWWDSWAIPALATQEEYHSWAIAAGFDDVNYRDISVYCARSLRRMHRMSCLRMPRVMRREYLGPGRDLRTQNIVGSHLQWVAFRRNLWTIGILTARKPPTAVLPTPVH